MSDINKLLENLTEEEKNQVLSILDEISEKGQSDQLNQLMLKDYDEIPVDIETFVSNSEYLGGSFEQGDSIYPFWKEKLKQIFEKSDEFNEIIFTGAIGLGKTTIAIIGMLYVLYNLLCLKNPQVYYGLPASSKIVLAFFNITLDLSFGVAYGKMQDYLQKSPWFLRNGTIKGNKNKVFVPNKGIEFRIGSKSEHGLGQDIFCLSGDTEIKTKENTYEKLDSLYKKIKDKNLLNLFSFNIRTKSQVQSVAYDGIIPTKQSYEIYKLTLEDGTIITGSEDHKILLSNGKYKKLKNIHQGDELYSISKKDTYE